MAKTLIGNVKGPKGDKGATGATGATGPAGATGAQGPKGDTGAAFTYDMFTAAQLAALKGPTGATGPKGDKGDKGDTGPAGAAGAAGQPGEDGQRGTGILNATSGISSYTTAVGGVTPAYRILLSTLKTQANVDEVLVGDSVRYSYYIYPIIYVDDTYAYMGTRVSIRGATGAAGAAGADGPAGEDGFSPTVEVVELGNNHFVTVTDKNGEQTFTVTNGVDGRTPTVGSNGNWWIGLDDTGIPATGPAGANGAAATIESVTAEVDGSYLAQPTVTVTPGGTPSNRTFHFAFQGLRGLSGGGSGDGGTTVQADWSVNDPNDPSYVKERTHWKEEVGVDGEIIPKTTLRFLGSFRTLELSGVSNGVQSGGKYIVTHNDTDYECVGKTYENGVYIGNGSFLGSSNLENTGEPFCITGSGGPYYYLYKADKTAETITVKVVGEKVVIWHKLDGGYLPEGLPYSEGVQFVELLPEITLEITGEDYLPVAPALVDEQTYTVMWNGIEYECVCSFMQADVGMYLLGNVDALMGTGDSGHPFVIASVPDEGMAMVLVLDGSEIATFSIRGQEEKINRMDGKLLPEGAPYVKLVDDVILEETVLADVEVGGSTQMQIFYNLPIGYITAGNTYEVTLDGVRYLTKAYASNVSLLSGTGVVLGSGYIVHNNSSITDFETPYAEVPFGLMVFDPIVSAQNGFTVWAAWANSIPERISIRCVSRPYKMDMDCLPDFPIPLVVNVKGDSDGYEADLPFEVVASAVSSGRLVFIMERPKTTSAYFDQKMYSFSQSEGGYLVFSRLHNDTEEYFSFTPGSIKKYTVKHTVTYTNS